MLVRSDLPDGRVSVGSGTLIRPKLVLTAAHVVFDDDGVPFSRVRAGPPEVKLLAARVLYPDSYIDISGISNRDVALLEITDSDWVPPRINPVRWGRLTGRVGGVRCEAIGFPRILRDPDGVRDSDQVSGEINPGSRRIADRYDRSCHQLRSDLADRR